MIETTVLELGKRLEGQERYQLAHLPTPLHHAKRLSEALGGPEIYIKRDELTGMPLAGNKTRMMEYTLPRILGSGCDCVVGGAALQSNYCRQLAAACAVAGLDVHLVLSSSLGGGDGAIQGNYFLCLLLGAQVSLVECETGEGIIAAMHQLTEDLRAQGRTPFLARMANTEDIGLDALAYVGCALEMRRQFLEQGIRPNAIYLASADTTQGGLLLGAKLLGETYQVVGINPISTRVFPSPVEELVASAANKGARELGVDIRLVPDQVTNYKDYVGDGYGIATPEAMEAIRLTARLEGILLDPVYSGKAIAGLIDHIRKGRWTQEETVVFINTGGFPALFAYQNDFDFADQISKRPT